MNSIKLMTDSAADISLSTLNKLDITMLHFPIIMNDKNYIAGEDFTNEEFYEILLKEEKIPTHAQVTPIEFMERYEEFYKAGYQDLIYVSINRLGSNTHDNALLAQSEFYEAHPEAKESFHIHVIDSKIYSGAYGYAVIEAGEKINRGASASEVVAYLKDWFNCVEIYFAPYSLDFVKKSGRVSVAAAFVGELLGLKPIISFIDGEVSIVEKVRGEKAIIPALLKHAKQRMVPETPFAVIKGMSAEEAKRLQHEAEKLFGYKSEGIFEAGPVIAINAGPKIVAIIIKGSPKH